MEKTDQLVILPPEVTELAERVSAEKKEEVNTVLNQIFAGTSDWKKQVEQIEVKDINDRMSMQLADVARKNAKDARLTAEKIFDAKRSDVQAKMQDYKTEDALWLKAKQTMQILFKDIEEAAKYKADFAVRFEAEQRELRTQQRLEKAMKFNPELTRYDIESMTDDMFNIFLTGLEKAHNDKIEAEKKAEADRLAKIKAEREEKAKLENEIRLQKLAEEQKKQEELKQLKAKEKAEKEAQKAPDKEKLEHFAKMIDGLIALKIDLKNAEMSTILTDAKGLLEKTSKYIRTKIL